MKSYKLQFDINREAEKITALSSRKTVKYEYPAGEEILPFNQIQIVKQAKLTYFASEKALKNKVKQNKKIDRRAKKKTNRSYNESKRKISCFNQ